MPRGRKPGTFREMRGFSLPIPLSDTLNQLAKDRGKSVSQLVQEALVFWRLHDKQGAIVGDREVFAYELGEIKKKLVRFGTQITQAELDTIRQTFMELGGKLDDEQSFNENVPKLYSHEAFRNNPHKIGPAQVAIFEMGSRLKLREAEITKRLSMLPTEKH